MIHSVRYHVPGQNVLVPHLLSPLVLVYYVHMQSVESVGHVNLSGIRIASRLASGWTRIRHFSEIEKKNGVGKRNDIFAVHLHYQFMPAMYVRW